MIQRTDSRTGLLLAGTLMLSTLAGCGQGNATSDTTTASAPAPDISTRALPGEWAYPLAGEDQWLTVGELTGIRLVSGDDTRHHLDISAEYLDNRHTDRGPLFATFDGGSHRPIFLTINDGQLETLIPDMTFNQPVEGLCLYQTEELYLFLLSEQHRAHQFLVWQTDNRLELHPVRTLPIPPESSDCAVDDASGTLYVAEDGVGVWAQGADPEAELAREPVAMTAPFGTLPDGPTGVAAAPGRLLVLAGDRVVQPRREGHDLHLDNGGATETLTVRWTEIGARLAVFDEDTSGFLVADWPLEAAPAHSHSNLPTVSALVETDPVSSSGDAADDPAIWVNRTDPTASRILGTNKRQGLHVYDLDGHERQFLPVGRVNNVDVRYGVPYRGDTADIAVATNRTRNSLSLFAITRDDGRVVPVTEIPTDLPEIYGLCLYQSDTDQVYAFANDKSGRYVQYRLDLDDSQWHGEPVREFTVDSQPEGCVADDQRGRLFVGEEDHGIWATSAEPDGDTALSLVDTLGERLKADVEGLSLYGDQYLVASSQGNNSFAVYRATPPYQPVGVFRIGLDPDGLIDGASETDGLAVTASNLGGPWAEGMLVVQDGRNVLPEQAQNFKLVPWQSIRQLLELPIRD